MELLLCAVLKRVLKIEGRKKQSFYDQVGMLQVNWKEDLGI